MASEKKPLGTSPTKTSEATNSFNSTVCVMGVSGCGKSTVATLIAEHFSVPFCEADDFHPKSNIQKMSAGIPLDDADREPWLIAVRGEIKRLRNCDGVDSGGGTGRGCVVACSALKQSYRDVLSGDDLDTVFIHLAGSFEQIYERIQQRTSHFMPASLLRSQFEALEPFKPDTPAIELSIDQPAESIAAEAINYLIARK